MIPTKKLRIFTAVESHKAQLRIRIYEKKKISGDTRPQVCSGSNPARSSETSRGAITRQMLRPGPRHPTASTAKPSLNFVIAAASVLLTGLQARPLAPQQRFGADTTHNRLPARILDTSQVYLVAHDTRSDHDSDNKFRAPADAQRSPRLSDPPSNKIENQKFLIQKNHRSGETTTSYETDEADTTPAGKISTTDLELGLAANCHQTETELGMRNGISKESARNHPPRRIARPSDDETRLFPRPHDSDKLTDLVRRTDLEQPDLTDLARLLKSTLRNQAIAQQELDCHGARASQATTLDAPLGALLAAITRSFAAAWTWPQTF